MLLVIFDISSFIIRIFFTLILFFICNILMYRFFSSFKKIIFIFVFYMIHFICFFCYHSVFPSYFKLDFIILRYEVDTIFISYKLLMSGCLSMSGFSNVTQLPLQVTVFYQQYLQL